MRLKISTAQKKNTDKGGTAAVTCVAWSSTEEIYSCGEDHILTRWHLEGGIGHATTIVQFPADFYPTTMQWHPRPSAPSMATTSVSGKKQSPDILLITTADGKFHLTNKTGRIEKSVEAHKGATLAGGWNNDGSAFLTAGEDGSIKIWSRSGMLRSTVVRGTLPVVSSCWSPDCSTILYSQGFHLFLQSINSNTKPHKWRAHDGLILAISWSHANGLIVSGGEDCRFKVWDPNGNQLYVGSCSDYPITAISWCPSGSYFAVGSFDTVKLCDKTGWSHSLEKLNSGSIFAIGWSNDSTQVAMASGRGIVFTGHVIDKRLEWNNYEATLVRRKVIQVRDVNNEIQENLEISDRVVQLEFGFDHLVVITPTQCHVYSVNNWNTPAIFELKNGTVSTVLLAEKHFLLVEWNTVSLYTYEGRLLGVPRWKNMTQEALYSPCISLCSDTLVIRDQSNEKLQHVLEVSGNKPIVEGQPYTHLLNVVQLQLNHMGSLKERQLALIDTNGDLYLVSIRTSGFGRVCKIAVMAQGICWATDANVLAAMLDGTLSVWLCPNCVHYSDRKVIRRTRIDKDNSEFGKHATIAKLHNGIAMIRRGDGALVASSFYTFFTSLHRHIVHNRWKDALSLCRIAQNEILWTCMAVMATDAKELNAAEEAYAAIGRFDKVDYILYIKQMPKKTEKLAEMALLAGDSLAAEGILLQNALIDEAIRMNIRIYNWQRALELSVRHKKLLDEVLEERRKYLRIIGKSELNQSFINLMATFGHAKADNEASSEKERESKDISTQNEGEDHEVTIVDPEKFTLEMQIATSS